MQDELTAAEELRIRRLPEQIEGTFGKLERLMTKAEAVGYRPTDWAQQWEALQSRFLTDPRLINREWDREFARARKQGEDR